MFAFDASNNKALASVFAFAASAIMMAMAIVPASPAGLIA
ncbi:MULTISPECIES: recombination protein F [Qipengyuania]|uniref:Recombination protein F n=1 Tax=Qipengyuania gelatinilytica TaxID=2867231 RepID=A0ABX9A1J4_9SPHN|nr:MULTISPECIES: recombination protein F [Qipengyuania]MBX7533295.1 recombination protein F [Qipengyuania xiamenensis]NNC54051.1 recombination protein F [Erythrobacter sp.]QZD94906.1 recombination protein F [Qipengyuania gelatinilytica]